MERKNFRTNAYLTVVTQTLIVNEVKEQTSHDILTESLDIISYIFESIPQDKLKELDQNQLAKAHLLSLTDPSIIEYVHTITQENYYDIVKNADKLLGDTISIPKITEESIDKVRSFQKKKNTRL